MGTSLFCMQRARKIQQKQAIQDIPLTRAKNTLMKETQAMSETTDKDNQQQKDNISSDEEFDTKGKGKSIQQKQAIQDIPLTRAKNTLMKETQAMSKTTDKDNQQQKDNISSDEEFDTKGKGKSIPIDKSYLQFGDDYITFSVNKVKQNPTTELIDGEAAFKRTFDQLKGSYLKRGTFQGLGKIEDWSLREDGNKEIFLPMRVPAVVNVFDVAWNDHHHLSLAPSDFLIMIGQGLAYHINSNAENLRKHFVDHEGKEDITIRRDDLRLGEDCDWSTMFGDFSQEIKKRVKANVYDIVIDDTSVATPLTRIVSEIILMDCFKAYYNYITECACGFPKITLRGTPDDWRKLLKKVETLEKMNEGDKLGLNWWLKELVPVVQKICEAGIYRKIDRTFWSNAYVRSYGYQVELIGGWINAFIPYLAWGRNWSIEKGRNPDYSYPGVDTGSYLEGISKVPFTHMDSINKITTPLEIYGGFLGGKYDEITDTVRPHYFWCIAHSNQEEKKPKQQAIRYEDSDEDF